LPNVGPYIYDVSISGFTRSSIYIYDISSLRVKRPSNAYVFVSVSQACPCQHLYFSNRMGEVTCSLQHGYINRQVWCEVLAQRMYQLRYRVSS